MNFHKITASIFQAVPVCLSIILLADLVSSPPVSAQSSATSRIICPKIVGGCDADQRNWPAMVALRLATPDEKVASYFCGGSVISERWVLTAAHCVPEFLSSLQGPLRDSGNVPHEGTLQIVSGAADLRDVTPNQVYGVESVVIHERFRAALDEAMQIADPDKRADVIGQIPLKHGHDIALLRLDRPWLGETAQLSLNAASDPQIPPGAPLRVAGFGRTDTNKQSNIKAVPRNDGIGEIFAGSVTLLQTLIPAVSTPDCAERYKDSLIGAGQICAGLEQGGSDSCGGDSGGPLMAYDERDRPHQVGLVSWGLQNCGGHLAYGVYTRISNFAGWIQSHTGPLTGAAPLIAREGLTSSQLDAALAQLEGALGPAQGRVTIGLRGGNTVRLGERIVFDTVSQVFGKLIILDVNAERKVTLLYPNKFVASGDEGLIVPGRSVAVPGPDYPGFDAFQATDPVGKGFLIALVAPETFDLERFAAEAGIRSKGFEPVKDPPNYFMQFIRQIETYLGLNTRSSEAIKEDLQQWGYAVSEYEITR